MKKASTSWSLGPIVTVCASGALSVYPGTCASATSSVMVQEVPRGSWTLEGVVDPLPLAFSVPLVALASLQV